jgi:hypothetical protein
MTAATQNRNTPSRLGVCRALAVAASTMCYAGTIAVMNASGYAAPASTATGLIALGVFTRQVDNTSGADGDEVVEIERGFFRFANSAGADEITATDIGSRCYLVDDQTVALTDGTSTRSVAGIIDDVDDLGVWVLIDPTSGANL